MKELGGRTLANTEHLHKDWTLVRGISALGRTAGDVARLAVAGWAGLDHRRQGRAGGDCRPVPFRRRRHAKSLGEQINRMAERGLARDRRGQGAASEPSSLPDEQHDFDFEFLGPAGPGRPGPPGSARGGAGMLHRRHPRHHDHGRLSGHGAEHRPADRPAARRTRSSPGPELDADERRRTAGAHQDDVHLRPRRAGAESCASSRRSRPTARSWP